MENLLQYFCSLLYVALVLFAGKLDGLESLVGKGHESENLELWVFLQA